MGKKTETKVVERERLIIETHADASAAQVTSSQTPAPKSEVKEKASAAEFVPLESHEFQNAGEQMEADRVDFLTEKLGMTEEKMAEHNKIRDEFFKETTKFWQKNPMRELSFNERRQMIELEEKVHARLEKLHGKKNWERYQKYREDYNMKGFKKQSEDNQPFIFMGL
jgi:hypothetical protein